jgi:hypothetical protein
MLCAQSLGMAVPSAAAEKGRDVFFGRQLSAASKGEMVWVGTLS